MNVLIQCIVCIHVHVIVRLEINVKNFFNSQSVGLTLIVIAKHKVLALPMKFKAWAATGGKTLGVISSTYIHSPLPWWCQEFSTS